MERLQGLRLQGACCPVKRECRTLCGEISELFVERCWAVCGENAGPLRECCVECRALFGRMQGSFDRLQGCSFDRLQGCVERLLRGENAGL